MNHLLGIPTNCMYMLSKPADTCIGWSLSHLLESPMLPWPSGGVLTEIRGGIDSGGPS
jgi:hypothetical protein